MADFGMSWRESWKLSTRGSPDYQPHSSIHFGSLSQSGTGSAVGSPIRGPSCFALDSRCCSFTFQEPAKKLWPPQTMPSDFRHVWSIFEAVRPERLDN